MRTIFKPAKAIELIKLLEIPILNLEFSSDDYITDFQLEEISAEVEISGDFKGNIILNVDKQAANHVAEIIFGLNLYLEEDERMFYESVMEFLNIICGNQRNRIIESGITLKNTIPAAINNDKVENYLKRDKIWKSYSYFDYRINLIFIADFEEKKY